MQKGLKSVHYRNQTLIFWILRIIQGYTGMGWLHLAVFTGDSSDSVSREIRLYLNLKLPDFLLDAFQIPKRFRPFAGVPQERRGMVNGGHPDSPFLHPLPMFFGNPKVRVD